MELVGIDDKRQITAVFAGTMAGQFLPIQLIYKGKTSECLPLEIFQKIDTLLTQRECYAELFGKKSLPIY